MILSVSRKTDIPAFYSEWFIDKIRKQSVCVRNPFNANQISRVLITPQNVDCIVFWTKNPKPLMKYLDELDALGYKYYFQFTITAYGKELEPKVKDKKELINTFIELSERLGKERVILRYDPIIITDKYDEEFHRRAFRKLCEQLHAYTEKIIFSFYDDYRKSSSKLKEAGIILPGPDMMKRISGDLASIAKEYNLPLETCAERIDLSDCGIKHASCIDGRLIERIIACKLDNSDTLDGNREACGCMKCIDIGEYDTCLHECIYCYANVNKLRSQQRQKTSEITSDLLVGTIGPDVKVSDRKEKDTRSNKIIGEQLSLL